MQLNFFLHQKILDKKCIMFHQTLHNINVFCIFHQINAASVRHLLCLKKTKKTLTSLCIYI